MKKQLNLPIPKHQSDGARGGIIMANRGGGSNGAHPPKMERTLLPGPLESKGPRRVIEDESETGQDTAADEMAAESGDRGDSG